MPIKLGILIIHGMGNQTPGFADDLIRGLQRRLGADAARVAMEPCYWADVLQPAQDRVWQTLLDCGRRLDWKFLRRPILSSLGDPVSYLSGFFREGRPVYRQIHERVRHAQARVAGRLDQPGGPLLWLAHSLGSVIATNYLWDEQSDQGIGRTAVEKGHTVAALITYGSSIPLFLPPTQPIECIRFPSPELPEPLRPLARWVNVYDPDDVLGYPLADIWDTTHGTVIEDRAIRAGGPVAGWTPLAHTGYHRSRQLLGIVAERVRALLAVT